MTIRILIIGDIRLYREGLAQALGRDDRVTVVGTASSPEEALARVHGLKPHTVVLDTAMTGGMELVRAIGENTETKVVALSVPETESEVLACAEAGVSGYLPRDGSLEDLITTLQSVQRGELPCSPQIAASLFRRVRSLSSAQTTEPTDVLTRRELEVLEFVDDGLTNKEIAQQLGVSPATVKNHVHNILEKLRVHRRGAAASHLRRRTSPSRRTRPVSPD